MMIPVFLMLLASVSLAEEPSKLPVSLNVGGFGVVTLDHGLEAEYIYFGPSVYLPLSKHLAFIPSLTIEAAPGSGAWGFALTGTFDYSVSEHVGLDLVPALLQDTTTEGTIPILAFGPGATYLFEDEVAVSVVCQGAYLMGEDLWVVNPGLNLAVPF